MKPKAKTKDEIESIAVEAIEDAVDFIESGISEDRLRAQRYYDGETDLGAEEGRSKVVSTKCRDTVNAIMPALTRAFLSTDKPVEFIPMAPDDVAGAEQATKYIQWKFGESDGYQIIHDAFLDALVCKVGIVKVYHEESSDIEIDEYTGLTEEQYQLVVNDPDVEILEEEVETEVGTDEMGMPTEVSTYDLKVAYEKPNGGIRIENIPPEDFFINSEATTIEDAYIVGHRNADMRVGDLVAMGYEFDDVIDYAGDETTAIQEEARQDRNDYMGDTDEGSMDPSMLKILVTEAYMKIDVEGTGIPRLYQLLCIGSGYHLLDYTLADQKPFAAFHTHRTPHRFFCRSVVEQIMNDQDAATFMLRGVLDNIALTNNPGMAVIESQVNMDDVLNNEIGAIKRVKSMDSFRPFEIPFTAGNTIGAMQYYDEVIETKTGVSRASMGLDPDALQNTTAAAVNAMTAAATGRVELYARNLAEGGMRQLFRLMIKLVRQHSDQETMMRLNGEFIPVDPRSWNTGMDLVANVGLGTGGEVEREMILREVLGHQMTIWQAYGPSNGLVTMTSIRNTLADIMKMGGIQNSDRYFNPMNPQVEQQLMQQAAQAAQGQQQSDPNAAFLQAEQMKAQMRAQSDQMKAQLDAQKLAMEDDRERDRMDMDLVLKAADLLGKYNVPVDIQAVQALMAAPR